LNTTRQDIAERYQYLGDAELLDLLHSGDLTELAQEIATAELAKRGIDPSSDARENPLSPAENAVVRGERWRTARSTLPWVYFAIVVGMGMFGLVVFVWQGYYTSQGMPLLALGSTIVDALCITALYGAIRVRPLLTPGIWQVVWVVDVGKIAFGVCVFTYQLWWTLELHRLRPGPFPNQFWVAVFGLLGPLLTIPMIWIVFNYAFRSQALWQKPPAGAMAIRRS
jgi:hypothetical protein